MTGALAPIFIMFASAPALAQSVDSSSVLGCNGAFSISCFNCTGTEDNDCSFYTGSGCTEVSGGTGPDHIRRFSTNGKDAWVEMQFEWGWGEYMNFYVGRGSICSNQAGYPCLGAPPDALDPITYPGGVWGYETPRTGYFEAESGQTYYVHFDETDFNSFPDYYVGVNQIACCYDEDHDGTYANPGGTRCPLLADPRYGGPQLVDCDDTNAAKAPGNAEICDGLDNNCNDQTDEGLGTNLYYRDNDGDGYGDPSNVRLACQPPSGYVTNSLDCDDQSFVRRPLLAETCDGKDNDCDLVVDEGTSCYDDDDDGWTEAGGDCDDAVRQVHPGANETCNGRDEDCDGKTDDGTACFDDDGDCYCETGPCAGSVNGSCLATPGGDCADAAPDVHPGATEVMGNGIDDDCDDVLDGGGLDGDHDGWLGEAGDCDVADATVHPGAAELPDGKDNDCDGTTDEGTVRYDDDGDCACETGPCTGSASLACLTLVPGDCDDHTGAIGPAATEDTDNGVDDDCNGLVDDGGPQVDDDGDGLSEEQGDCDDEDAEVLPGEPELNNGVDDDCDGETDEDFHDLDRDGVTTEDGDCDDGNGWVRPGLSEMCDSIDNDCDEEIDEGCDEDEIVDPVDTGDSGGCGCDASGGGAPWLLALGLLAVRRRRAA